MACIRHTGRARKDGYGDVSLRGKKVLCHRLAYCTANGVSLDDIRGKVVRHSCDNPACVNPEHLVLGTQYDNVHDMISRGRKRSVSSEAHPSAKLDWDAVAAIRASYAPGVKGRGYEALARKYGVTKRAIVQIIKGQTWRT